MNNIITFIIGTDENKQHILMDIEVREDKFVSSINIAGLVFNEAMLKKLNQNIEIDEELFFAMRNKKPMNITSEYKDLTQDQILKKLSEGDLK